LQSPAVAAATALTIDRHLSISCNTGMLKTIQRGLGTALAIALIATAGANAAAPAAKRPLTSDDIYRMEAVSEPQLSPDGQWIAYLVTTSDRDADEVRSAIWMVSWDGTQHVQLAKPSSSIESPRWSPDGRYLSYLAKTGEAEHDQLMLLDRRGGEPRALTSVTDDIESYAWSPDGRRLVLVIETNNEPSTASFPAKGPKPIVIDSMFFKEDVTGYIGRSQKQHLYLFDVDAQKLEPLSVETDYNDVLPAWSPDGKQIAFVRTSERAQDMDGKMDIELIEARPGAAPRRLLRPFAPNVQHLAWSPDGKQVAFLQGLEPKYSMYMHDVLWATPTAGGAPRALTAKLDRGISSYKFEADGKTVTLLVEDDTTQYPARLNLATGTIDKLITRPLVVYAQTSAGAHRAIVASDDTTSSEVYALEAGGMRRLTHHSDALLDEIELGAAEDFSFHSKDGTEVHGMLVKPPGYVPGRKYPTILWIHGGPDLQDDHSADFQDSYQFLRQIIAANGYLVFGVNYRGSSGRGFAFANSINADWGRNEVEDLLTAVDTLVARGIADPKRLGIGGWSYGGMLTDYTIASDSRFLAAVSGAGSGNQLSMYGSSEYVVEGEAELGPPWRNTELYLKLSYPFFHADLIHTPTLFMGGDKDFNVPIVGGEQMYQALRTLGVPTQLIVYPDQNHELSRPSFLKDRYDRTAAWFGKYLQPAP
jgi:dipeptidyl aminopeptidase/acylaminoacyl peptidase